ncbi:hypothetical protein NOM01_11015 [Sporolactobacillus sp. STSJ-5]|uniref:hypothetical protein n=1 Tax=Sporolactobacillus sp. STSJ-5 TaxID=2965076 RepID=UPI00210509F2|nr:hypothetical protein [Sporolactobacillus sp. STSJ-5]MCQ2010546.1 hypothetical protein [Sporolactobacillus sp. STSJ-5]
MIDYVDPIPPVLKFFKTYIPNVPVYGNEIPTGATLPVLMIKNAGGSDYTRLQLLVRAVSSSQATQALIRAMNMIERYAGNIQGLDVMWCQHETAPMPDIDDDTGKPESWCYMRLDNCEA